MVETLQMRDLGSILPFAVGPVVLISGVGLLLLTLTNRLGRIVDRARILARERMGAEDQARARLATQLRILSRRARLIRLSVTLCALCILLVGVLITVLFLAPLLRLELAAEASLLFVLCMLCLIAAMVVFLQEIYLSLEALDIEITDDAGS